MTQDERWKTRYEEVKDFIESNHRIEEHDMLNWVKQQRKLLNAGKLKEERMEAFEKLLVLCEKYRRVNQYQ